MRTEANSVSETSPEEFISRNDGKSCSQLFAPVDAARVRELIAQGIEPHEAEIVAEYEAEQERQQAEMPF